jgi:hypothetical protein
MNLIAYHGTNQRFDRFERNKARLVNDYFGGGAAYCTDSMQLAKSYARSMQLKYGGEKIVYKVSATIHKLFDVDHFYTGKELLALLLGTNTEQFARYCGLLNLGSDKYKVLASLKDGSAELTGNQIFKGLSGGMIHTARARDKLEKNKYDSLRYNMAIGQTGTSGNSNHVYIIYSANNIRITNKYIYSPAGDQYSVIR